MRFLAVMKGDADTEARKPPSPELMARMDSFMAEVAKAGVLVSSEGLHPSANAFNLKLANGKLTVTDGPFAETKEVLASYALFDVKSKDEAIEWTSRFLEVLGHGNVDIYPVFEYTASDFETPENALRRAAIEERGGDACLVGFSCHTSRATLYRLVMTSDKRPLRFLFAMFQGGGNIPLIMPIVGELVRRGHEVRILAGPGIRGRPQPVSEDFLRRIQSSGAQLVPFALPEKDPYAAAPAVRGVAFGWVPKRFELMLQTGVRTALWSPVWASNVTEELRRGPADALVSDFCLFGAIAAGEASTVPTGVLVHNAYAPKRGRVPPSHGRLAALRQVPDRWIAARLIARDGLPTHNATRRALGLPPLRSWPFEECDRAARALVLGYESFDFPEKKLHSNVRYVGTPIDDADAEPGTWTSPWPMDDARPLVVVSMSTLPQGQGPAMHRIVEAVGAMDIRALVTLGPSLKKEDFQAADNVVLEPFVKHSAVLPYAAVMVSQCGLGTLSKALRNGVPLLCMPLIADQPHNAARIVARGAGLLLRPDASAAGIRAALTRLLEEPSFREAARTLGEPMVGDRAETRAADELEAIVHTPRP